MFVDHLLSEPLEAGPPRPPDATYNETRGFTIFPDGTALIEAGWHGDTVTKVVNEDRDHAFDVCLATKTTVDREEPDHHEASSFLATQTLVRSENPDHHDLDLMLGTDTRVAREDPDHAGATNHGATACGP